MAVVDLLAGTAGSGADGPQEGVAIALSGGGYRAMLFHTGVLWRLGQLGFFQDRPINQSKSGIATPVGRLERISSVSGGSITSAVLALALDRLESSSGPEFDLPFIENVVTPIRRLASTTLAGSSPNGIFQFLKNALLPGGVSAHIGAAYRNILFGQKTLQDLPDRIRFTFNASNLQSGALWRFSKPFMRDWRVGEIRNPGLPLATVVTASSAFPPMLAPLMLSLNDADYIPHSGDAASDIQRPPFTTSPTLADGGVYDNLGLETCYKRYRTLLVSNAGKPFTHQAKVRSNSVSIGSRCLDMVDAQVISLRKRLLIDALTSGERTGAFWDIQQDISVHKCPSALPCPPDRTRQLASVPTDLAAKDKVLQERFINWGYAVSDASLRAWFNTELARPNGFPYPTSAV